MASWLVMQFFVKVVKKKICYNLCPRVSYNNEHEDFCYNL